MSYRIIFTINNTSYDVLRCRYGLHREVDTKGRPTTGLLGGTMFVQMESSSDVYVLEQFFLKNEPPFCGKMEIFDEDGMPLRTIFWDEAHICAVSEEMASYSSLPMAMDVAISPLRLDINRTIQLDRRWPQVAGACWQKYVPEEHPVAAASEEVFEFDEQIELVDQNGKPAVDVLYCIEYEGEIVLSGRTDRDGLTERIPKSEKQHSYKIFWAEEAFARLK